MKTVREIAKEAQTTTSKIYQHVRNGRLTAAQTSPVYLFDNTVAQNYVMKYGKQNLAR